MTLAEQIAEVQRELKQRERAYARWVGEKRMTQEASDRQIGRMRAALATLEAVQAGTPPPPDPPPAPPPQGDFLNG